MNKPAIILACALLLASGSAFAQANSVQLPRDTVPAELADSEGQIVVAQCSACHSLDYITTQPRAKGAQFWRDSVTKMVNVYGARITPETADAVAGVLARKFG